MSIKPKPGHWYVRRCLDVVPYGCSMPSRIMYPHSVGGKTVTDEGFVIDKNNPHGCDLIKDLGTTDPRLTKKPRKKATKKVRIWFAEWRNCDTGKKYLDAHYRKSDLIHVIGLFDDGIDISYGPIFSQIISVPIHSNKTKAKS